MERVSRLLLLGVLLGVLPGCAMSPTDQAAAREAWAARDAEREGECLRAGQGRWVAGGCVVDGGGGGGGGM